MADLLIPVAGVLIAIALLLALYRFVCGPTTADRIAAFDVATVASIGGIALIALLAERAIYLDAALVYGLLSFLGVIVAARYLDRGL
ncbi:monovalent cation/H+ antiporter complex subunit F [Magnetofaba australis]|uniref:Putative multiple resistance and pH regulation protein F n=1 Tax=Magnetofaba australis IT-1 TaxID=1434232 RepID=A0A1Y2K3X7_9PROT|nr:monovalent cation/H+ antiporter complex subunit F [Magnetofaba australis]OSM04067.1 putative multiple resistance and pH regulation protein F [Magnetofaba australis IT-1]